MTGSQAYNFITEEQGIFSCVFAFFGLIGNHSFIVCMCRLGLDVWWKY